MTLLAVNRPKWVQPSNKAGQQLVTPSLLLHKGLTVVLGKAISEFAQTGSEATSTGKVNKLQSLMMTCALNGPCNKIMQQLVLPSPFDANGIDAGIGQNPFKIWTNRISRHVNWNGKSFPKRGDDCFGHQ